LAGVAFALGAGAAFTGTALPEAVFCFLLVFGARSSSLSSMNSASSALSSSLSSSISIAKSSSLSLSMATFRLAAGLADGLRLLTGSCRQPAAHASARKHCRHLDILPMPGIRSIQKLDAVSCVTH